jgi:hypothetical protein
LGFLPVEIAQPVQDLGFTLPDDRPSLAAPDLDQTARATGDEQASQFLLFRRKPAIPVGIEFGPEISLIGSGFALAYQPVSIPEKLADHIGRLLKLRYGAAA